MRRWAGLAVAIATSVASSAFAIEFVDDLEPIDGKANRVDLTLGGSNPRTSTVTDCGPDASYVTATYDSLFTTLTIEDGTLCGSDVTFFLFFEVSDIAVYIGTSANEVTGAFGTFDPVLGDVDDDGFVELAGLRVLFEADVRIGQSTSSVLAPVDGDFGARVEVDSGTGRLTIRELVGTVEGTVDPDGPGGGLPPQTVRGELTLNLEGVSLAPVFAVSARDFESGTTDAWDVVVPGR